MSMLKAGVRLKSSVCDTQIMVIKAQGGEQSLTCGGVRMLDIDDPALEGRALDPGYSGGTQLGKRYVDAAEQYEFLCTKGGAGTLALDGAALTVKLAKSLPSSD